MHKNTLKRLIKKGLSQHKIAKELKVSQTTIGRRLKTYGLKTVCKPGPSRHRKNANKVKCLNCKKRLKHTGTYCSINCNFAHKKSKRYKEIENNKNFSTFMPVKRYLIDKYGKKCFKCGWAEKNMFSKSVPIDTHHIDGNRKNNRLSNIELLCPNCHSMTKTYRVLNRKQYIAPVD